jgi:hypothetical protein
VGAAMIGGTAPKAVEGAPPNRAGRRIQAHLCGTSRRSGSAAFVMAIQPAGFVDFHHPAQFGSLDGPRDRAVHGERTITTPVVIVLEIVAREPA